ncbi:MAG: acyltransferase, partial [Myxococcota bacterium]
SEIDALKFAGILTVILIHSLRAPWDPRISPAELWLGAVTRFAVPGFLFCSGFLYATADRIRAATVGRRIRRVLIPYGVASVAAQLWWLAHGQGRESATAVTELLLASSFGPYYYVFVHFGLVLIAPALARLPRTAIAVLAALLVASQGVFESSPDLLLPFFWHLRNPLLWWGYFLLGWLIRLHYETIQRWIGERRGLLVAGFAVAVAACTWFATSGDKDVTTRVAMWLEIHAVLGLLFAATCGLPRAPGPIRAIADATYAIYLFHLFFIYAVEDFMRPATNRFDGAFISAAWFGGLIGSLLLIRLARFALGSRSRDVIGA